MDPMEEICSPPEGAKREEDDDLRIMAELNNPRIYKDVQNILRQEQRVKVAITRKKSLPYPCKCHQLCEFGELLLTMYNAFEKLYEAYDALHSDYSTLFRASAFRVDGTTITLYEDARSFAAGGATPAPPEVNIEDLSIDVNLREERQKALADEDIWRKTYELHMECVRLCMLKVAKPEQDRFMDWVNSHIWAVTKCICYHCDYRDALLSYRHAILTLHMEYLSLYCQYLALLYCQRVQDSRPTAKTLIVRGMNPYIMDTMFSS
ncbi:hypothetical protein T265_01149 [Opisthorchis viverrini]|uniref:Uncharacterized protein n=1 Tax=Opisthorchis viverrini TaxID=6198 RepID=A0A075A0H1_OPIVI|nr:hypothetical protein T265_01149 [Opisthorchis viverrini]KER32861.1 hypothetical protein T265_01149 [Opisthorchis viverrini]